MKNNEKLIFTVIFVWLHVQSSLCKYGKVYVNICSYNYLKCISRFLRKEERIFLEDTF